MWQPGGGAGGGCRRSPAPLGPRREQRRGPAPSPGEGSRRPGPPRGRAGRRGRKPGRGPAPPARSLTSAMAVCAREAVAAPGSPDAGPRAHWLQPLGGRGRRGGAGGGARAGGRVVGARTGTRGRARDAQDTRVAGSRGPWPRLGGGDAVVEVPIPDKHTLSTGPRSSFQSVVPPCYR